MSTYEGRDRRAARGRRLTDAPVALRALVIDPHQDTQELLEYCLEMDGYAVSTTGDGGEAYVHAATRLPDLITTELSLPRQSGFELIHQLHENTLTRDIPILVLTGHAQEAVLARALEHGAAAALAKPVMPEELMRVVTELMLQVAPARLVERQLRRKLLTLRLLARRYSAGPELREQLGRFIDRIQEAVLLLDEEGHLLATSAAADHLIGNDKRSCEHSVFNAIVDERVSTQCWERARVVEHWSGAAKIFHRDGHLISTRAVYMAAGVGGLHVAAFAPVGEAKPS